MEKISINPSKVRAYGNIITPKTASDFTPSTDYKVIESTDIVDGAETKVFGIESLYSLSFDSESYTSSGSVTVYVTVLKDDQPELAGTVYVNGCGGSGSGILAIGSHGVAEIIVTGINQSGTLTATYKTGKATATVTYEASSYSLAFSQSTYTCDMLDGCTVSCTLKEGNTPMSGQTITFSYEGAFGPTSVTATTNSSGVATYTFAYFDFTSLPATVTATYSGVTATCTIEEGL